MARATTGTDLRDVIRVDRRTYGVGGTPGPWSPFLSGVRARIATTRGGEEVRANRLSGISNFDVVIRSTEETRLIGTEHRLVNETTNVTYKVKWIGNLDDRNRFLTLTCEVGGLTDD